MKTVGWGVLGCSHIVERRAGAALLDQENSRLVAFHSRSKGRACEFADKYGAQRAYDDLKDFLKDDAIDIVYVATEVDRHAALTIAAANAGKHVLVEKPMALNSAECVAMIAAAEKNRVNLSVAYYMRFTPKSQAMKRVIDEGRLGRVVRANIRVIGYYNPEPSDPKYWRVTGRGAGNVLADIGSHRLDLLTYLIGKPARVYGFADRLSMSYEAADTETALVQFENGAHVVVLANSNVPHSQRDGGTSVEIFGTKGSLLTDPLSDDPVAVVGADMQSISVSRPENLHLPMMDDFARAAAEDRPPRFSGLDGMWATAVIQGVYDSAKSGKVISISEYTGDVS